MKLNVKALNECLGIDGPIWIEDNLDNYVELSKHIPVCKPPIHSGESHHMKKEEYRKRVSEKLKGRKGHPAWNKGISLKEEIKKKITGEGNGQSQWWKITFDDGGEITMCGLSNWCKENGYSKGHISKIYHKQRKRHRDIVTVEKLTQAPAQQTQETL